MARTTHTDIILDYLRTHKGITSLDAFEKFGITRLSATIFCLRKRGYNIVSTDKTCINRYGYKVTFSEYQLVTFNEYQLKE